MNCTPKVHSNQPPADSPGWTIVLMDRASRFIWDLSCGEHDRALFEQAIQTLAQWCNRPTTWHSSPMGNDAMASYSSRFAKRSFVRGTAVARARRPEGVQVRVKNKGCTSASTRTQTSQISSPTTRTSQHHFNASRARHSGQSCGSLQRRPAAADGLLSTQNEYLRKKTNASKAGLMFTGSCTTSCAHISPPNKCQLWL